MSDIPAEPVAEAAPLAETDLGAPADTAPADPYDTGADTFPRAYVEKLRQEQQQYRQRWGQYEQTFGGFHPDDRQALLNLANVLRSGDVNGAAKMMRAYAEQLTPAQQQQVADAAQQAADAPGDRPLTQAQLEQILNDKLSERDQAQMLEREVEAVYSEAGRLGYPPGHPDHLKLLVLAQDHHDGNLEAAAQALKAEREGWIQEYLAGKQQPAPRTAPRTGATPSDGKGAPKDLKDAKAAMEERLRNTRGQFV